MSQRARRVAWAGRIAVAVLGTIVGSAGWAQVGPAGDPKPAPQVTSLPKVPEPVLDALQDRKFDEAVRLIDIALQGKEVVAPDYLRYLKARALAEGEKWEAALAAYEELATKHPQSDWASRARFGRAEVFTKQRNYRAAAEVYQSESQRLLSTGRRDKLAAIYLEFADKWFEGVPSADPAGTKQKDFTQAAAYYEQALKLEPSRAVRQRVELRIADCQLELKQHDKALAAYKAYVEKYAGAKTKAEDRVSVDVEVRAKYRLGRTQLEKGQRVEARRTWTDLLASAAAKSVQAAAAKDAAAPKEGAGAKSEAVGAESAGDLVARAAFGLAHTYGLPEPGSDADLEHGIAAHERFLKAYPQHKLAAEADFEIAQALLYRGRNDRAVARLQALIADPARAETPQVAQARQRLGDAFLAQQKYAEAIAAWREFLDRHPTNPQWSAVQQSIVDTEYAVAEKQRADEDFAAARKSWETFLNKYPLDPRAPRILLEFGRMKHDAAAKQDKEERKAKPAAGAVAAAGPHAPSDAVRKLFEEALADWQRLGQKYPQSAEASEAAYMGAVVRETRLGRLAEALEAYRKVTGPYQDASQRRIAELTANRLEVATERKYRTNEPAKIRLTTRNLEKVTVKVYRVDPEAYFRKMHEAGGVEALDVALIDPDKTWEHPVAGFEKYRSIDGEIPIPTEGPATMAVTVSSDKLEATTLLVVSDVDVIVKSSRNELFVFAENLRTQKAAAGAVLLVSDGKKVFAEEKTGADGVLQKSYEELKSCGDLRVFCLAEGHAASTVADLEGLDFAVGLAPVGRIATDRPAYRAGQVVNVRGIVRRVAADRFEFKEGETYRFDAYDPRGRLIHSSEVKLGRFGTFAAHFVLPDSVPQGACRLHLHRADGGLDFDSAFLVHEYSLDPVRLSVDLPRQVWFRGETVTATISLKYHYGAPLAGRTVTWTFGDEGERTGTTDDKGQIAVEFPTLRYDESRTLTLSVRHAERNLSAEASVFVATQGFDVAVSTRRKVYLAGETFDATVGLVDPAGKPVAADVSLEVVRIDSANGRTGETVLETHALKTEAEKGEATKTVRIEKAGRYVLRATGTDRFGNRISGAGSVTISGDDDRIRLRILADQHRWKTGDVAQVRLHWRDAPALALVTYEGARILGHRTLELKTGINVLEIPMLSSFAPNFDLAVAVMETGKFHQARSEFRVAQRMRIELKPDQATLRPGEDLTVEITTTDAQGKPVSAEVSLGLVQKSLLERFGAGAALESLFTGDLRVVSVRGTSSATFAYRPTTRGISEFLLAEEERKAAETREETSRSRIRDQRRIVGRGRDPQAPPNGGPGRGQQMEQAAQMALEASEQLMELNDDEDGNFAEVSEATVRPNDDDSLSVAVDAVWAMEKLERSEQALNQSLDRLGANGELRKSLQLFGRPTPGGMHDRPQSDAKGFAAGGFGGGGGANFEQDASGDGRSGAADGAVWGKLPNASRLALALQRGVQLSQGQFEAGRWKEQLADEKENVYAVDRSGALQVVNGLPAPRIAALAAEGLRLLPGTAASETAYWNPSVVTDAQGKARVVFRLPERSTAWTLHAQGIDADVLAGQAEAGIVTRKELFGEIKLPPAFTVGDVARVAVEVHDAVVEKGQKIAVRLETKTGEKTVAVDRTIESTGPGIAELEFPVEIAAGEKIEFSLTVSSGKFTDLVRTEVPIRPLGLTVFATQSGTAAQSTVVLVDPDPNLSAAGRTLEILIGPTVNRALLDAVIGSGSATACDADLPTSAPERAVSDVLGGVALLKMLGQSRETGSPEAQALTGRIASAVSALVSSQREDGTWNWAGRADSDRADRHLTSRVAWALASARKAGFAVPAPTFDKTVQALRTAFAASAPQDREGQAILLHGLTEAGAGDFAFANRLHRDRNLLSPSGLLHLAIVFVRLDRPEMAKDLLALVKLPIDGAASGTGALPAPGPAVPGEAKPGEIRTIPWMQGTVELRALWMIALSETEPTSPKLAALADALLAARRGGRWLPEKANGPALVALGTWFGRTKFASEKYVLSVFANEKLVERIAVDPSVDPSRRIAVPARMLVEGRQKIHFDLEGRGRFSYGVVLGGFVPAEKLKSTTTDWTVKRTWEPAQRLLDGQPVPRGFGIVAGAVTSWQNFLAQLPAGERGEVSLDVSRIRAAGQTDEAFDYLVLIDPVPAGATVLEDTVKGSFDRYEVGAGEIVFYLGDRPNPGTIRYSLAGTLPGSYKAGPAVVRSFYRPERIAVAEARPLTVLARNEKSADAYRLTPVELFELGRRLFAKGDRIAAGKHLDELFRNFRLRDDVYRQTVEMLFRTALTEGAPPKIVEFFEIIKEKYPDVEIDFAAISQVGNAYLTLGEYERCFLVFRATVEAGFERETQIAGFLDGRGEFLRSVGVMESLLREYPAEPWTASATYALAQEVYGKAPGAVHDARLKEAGATRVDLLAGAIRMLDHFVAVWPRDPAADQAGFSLANALLDLDRFEEAVERCDRFAVRYPQSPLLDSFWYVIGYGQFALGRHDEALKTCLKVAEFKRRDPSSGTEVAALNREQALYIRGQVFHSLGRPAEAVAEYEKVRTNFADAAEAIDFFTRKEIAVPEVSTFDPAQPARLELKFRNVAEAGVKVYRIDLLKFGLLQRNLDRITSINLAGIRPYHEQTVPLGDGKDFRDKTHALTLPLKEEGAYLVVCRAENLYSSGLVLVSPLRLQLQEDAESGRVRTTVRDVVADRYVHDVLVKVIGSADGDFRTGRTDLRGIFTADDVHGTTTVIARASDHRYAFHRGKTWLGPKAQPQTAAPPAKTGADKPAASGKDALLKNLRQSNESLQQEQRGNYRGLLDNKKSGVKANLAR